MCVNASDSRIKSLLTVAFFVLRLVLRVSRNPALRSLRRRPETICLDEDDDYSVDSPAIIDPELQRETIRLQFRQF